MEKVREVVRAVLNEIGETEGIEELVNAADDTRLLGSQGHLDSLGVVLLVSELEEAIGDEFGRNILLADDRAMSQRSSPFRNVGSLCAYIEEVMQEDEG
jgi:acyl carrier protein